LAIHQLLGRKY